jgi:hypothetical protein
MKGEGKMKREIKGIMMILLLISAIAVVPLSVEATMRVMQDSELEMTTGQMTIGTAWNTIFGNTMNNYVMPVIKLVGEKNFTLIEGVAVTILTPLLPTLVKVNQLPWIVAIGNINIPFTK